MGRGRTLLAHSLAVGAWVVSTLSGCRPSEPAPPSAAELEPPGRLRDLPEVTPRPYEGTGLDQDPVLRDQVLSQSFSDIVERVGPVAYEGRTRFRIERNGHEIERDERTQIDSRAGGDLRVRQWDAEDQLLREAVRVRDRWYVRHGQGALRRADYAQNQRLSVANDAFSALAGFCETLGPALGLRDVGRAADGRVYRAVPAGEPPPDPALELVSVEGRVVIEERTGVPRRADLQALLETDGVERPGEFELEVHFELRPAEARPFDVSDAVDPIMDRSSRHDPLAFLQGETRTSTVIGGD